MHIIDDFVNYAFVHICIFGTVMFNQNHIHSDVCHNTEEKICCYFRFITRIYLIQIFPNYKFIHLLIASLLKKTVENQVFVAKYII